MKPFSLESWKAGEPVITRDGREVKDLTYFENRKSLHKLVGIVDGILEAWIPEGHFLTKDHKSDYDLFHPEGEMWVNVYESGTGQKNTSNAFDSYDKAIFNHELLSKQMHQDAKHIGTFKLVR